MNDRKDSKVVDIAPRRERWHTAYTVVGLEISVSSHGRMYIMLDGKEIFLDMTDAVDLMGQVSKKYEQIAEL